MKQVEFPLNVLLLLGLKREDYVINKLDITATMYYVLYSNVSERNAKIFIDVMRDHVPYAEIGKRYNIGEARISNLMNYIIGKLKGDQNLREMLRLGIVRYYEIMRRNTQDECKRMLSDHKIHGVSSVREFPKNTFIEELPMSRRLRRCVQRIGVETVGDMLNPAKFNSTRVLNEPGIGATMYNELVDFMVGRLGAPECDWPRIKPYKRVYKPRTNSDS